MAQRIEKKQKTQNILVQCLKCRKAELHQWRKDPIIAICADKNDRQVATTFKVCKIFAPHNPSITEPHITHHD